VTRLIDLPLDRAKRLAELERPDFATRPSAIGPVLSNPPADGFGVLARGGAPTDRSGTALAAELSSAAWGGFGLRVRLPLGCAHLHCGVVHGRQLDLDDSGTGRAAVPAAMVRTDHRSGVFDANESCQWVT
jgi:hypothetical protein